MSRIEAYDIKARKKVTMKNFSCLEYFCSNSMMRGTSEKSNLPLSVHEFCFMASLKNPVP
jgi:hypothetical protein